MGGMFGVFRSALERYMSLLCRILKHRLWIDSKRYAKRLIVSGGCWCASVTLCWSEQIPEWTDLTLRKSGPK